MPTLQKSPRVGQPDKTLTQMRVLSRGILRAQQVIMILCVDAALASHDGLSAFQRGVGWQKGMRYRHEEIKYSVGFALDVSINGRTRDGWILGPASRQARSE